jgi:hypothetical protein
MRISTLELAFALLSPSTLALTFALLSPSASAFSQGNSPLKTALKQSSRSSDTEINNEIEQPKQQARFDPLGLYPKSAPERQSRLLEPLEEKNPGETSNIKPIKDPLYIYDSKSPIDSTPMSPSLPFLARPVILEGVPGDRGFDPFNFASTPDALQWQREAEVKHGRLAMLAAAGWPMAELLDKQLAASFNLKPLLVFQDRVPSVLNGGLLRTPLIFWAAALGVGFAIESFGQIKQTRYIEAGMEYTPGDLGFDPLGLAGKSVDDRKDKLEAELFNGRLAMLAVTGFALQEWWTQNAVINETPIFFKPINIALEQLMDAGGNGLL